VSLVSESLLEELDGLLPIEEAVGKHQELVSRVADVDAELGDTAELLMRVLTGSVMI
jgi:hypothetical protein